MAAFTAVNHQDKFSPSILAQDVEAFAMEKQPIVIDLRDPISFSKASLYGSNNLSQEVLRDNISSIPKEHPILLISDDGQKGHVALRMLKGLGIDNIYNLSGGYISLERYARAIGYKNLDVTLFPVVKKSVEDLETSSLEAHTEEGTEDTKAVSSDGPIILDVRTPMEFAMGAHPKAINVDLDGLGQWASSIEDKNREIILYCASGARSSYGVRILKQMGFSNVQNGGSLHSMMASGL